MALAAHGVSGSLCFQYCCRFDSRCAHVLQVRMKDPVIPSDGVCYEREALEDWVSEHGTVSPATGTAIRADFTPTHMLRSLLQAL